MISMTAEDVFAGIILIIAFIAVLLIVDAMLQEWDEADDEDYTDD